MKVLVIGSGSIGRRHSINAGRYGEVAVFDQDQAVSKKVAEEAGGVSFPSIDQAIEWGPEAAVIATPGHSHLAIARQLAGHVRRLLIEKPLCIEMDEIDITRQALESQGTRTWVVSNMRYHPGPRDIKASMDRIGTTRFARAHFGNWLPGMRPGVDYRNIYCASMKDGGGVIFDCIHEIDYLSWLLGPVEAITGSCSRLSDLEIDGEDWAVIIMRHRSGARSEIHLDYLQRFKQRGCEIVGSEGTVSWSSSGKSPEDCRVSLFECGQEEWEELYASDPINDGCPYSEMIEDFLSAEPSDRLSTFEDGVRAVQLAHEARKQGQEQS
ncbi:MAG: hypothetical protein CMJ40_08220 [Phycisphaerae bacterium]|nr:hypothetical protein [Phycisphaerae bacterium]|tara:strand:+ start:2101 stop:3075 length:975 start_codon:yes stop_codon:yes gene_type:complete